MQLPEDNKSEWNQASVYMLRLHDIMVFLNETKANKDLLSWKDGLYMLYSELFPVLAKDERDSMKDKMRHVESEAKSNNANYALCFNTFFDSELFLRNSLQRHGLLVPVRDNPRHALSDDRSY